MATIDKLWIHSVGNISIGIFTLEHCDPHATCRAKNGLWTIRIDFSFIDDDVSLRDVIPAAAQVAAFVVGQLLEAVRKNLADYRALWWQYQKANPASQPRGACCLNNRMIQGRIVTSATFNPADSKTTVALADGTVYIWPP
jgi:hypothetical protein